MKKRVKLEDIAKIVGISKMSVSLAMRGDRSISPKTTQRIQSVARELGYTPNRMAQNLANGKSNTIALLISAPLHDDYQNQIIRGAVPYAMSRGYTIFVGPMSHQELESSYMEKYNTMMVDGFLSFHSMNSSNYRKLQEDGVPFVLYTKYLLDLESDYVVCNDYKGGFTMTQHLIQLGHTKFAFVYDYRLRHSSEVLDRIRGFRDALNEHGIMHNESSLVPFISHYHLDNMDSKNILQNNPEFSNLMKSEERPTAIFVCNDITTSSVYTAIKQLGLNIPQDISIGGYEGVYLGTILDPPLTTVASPIQEIGRRACQILIDKIEGVTSKTETLQVKLDPKLLIRGSTAKPTS